MLQCTWRQNGAVRGSARQDGCRVKGHARRLRGEQLRAAAAYSVAAWLRALFVGGRTEPTDCLFFVFLHHSRLPTRLLSSWLIQSEGAPVDGVDVNHPSVYGWRPYPLRRGRRCKLKMTRSHLSGRFLLSRVCFASENFPPLTYCFAALQKEISPVTALLTDIFFDIRGWAVLMLDSDTQWLHHFTSYI